MTSSVSENASQLGVLRKIYSEELRDRKSRRSFSLRSYAKTLGLSRSVISDFLSGKSALSNKSIKRLLAREAQRTRSNPSRLALLNRLSRQGSTRTKFAKVSESDLGKLNSPLHLVLLSLTHTPFRKIDTDRVARKFKATRDEVESAIRDLSQLGLVKFSRGELVRTSLPLKIGGKGPSAPIREMHRKAHYLSLAALQHDYDSRDMAHMSLAIDSPTFEKIKKECKRFRRKINRMANQSNGEAVYFLNMSLFKIFP